MIKNFSQVFSKTVVRGLIVVFFLALIGIFLYIERIYESFGAEKVLTIYTPYEVISVETAKEFERQTGIKVRITYFDTNEELLAKFRVNRGVGYDVIVPSDFMVELLRRENLLLELDHAKLKNFSSLDKRLMDKFYDPGDKYTVPVAWIPYGIGYNRDHINLDDGVGWDVVFNPEKLRAIGVDKISMLNDALEVVSLAAIYLFGSNDNLTEEKLEQVKKLLINQKQIVESYAEAGAKFLLISEVVPFAVLPAARVVEIEDQEKFGFVIPHGGSLIDILTLAIPATCKNVDEAHQLVDFLISRDIGVQNYEIFYCNPSNVESYKLVDPDIYSNKNYFPENDVFDGLHILNNQLSLPVLEKLWFSIKSN